jgi:hypothetical protein
MAGTEALQQLKADLTGLSVREIAFTLPQTAPENAHPRHLTSPLRFNRLI